MNGNELIKDWHAKPITDTVRLVLADGIYPTDNPDRWEQFIEDTDNDRLLAMLETPSCDIELEMWTKDGDDFTSAGEKEDKRINLSFPILVKTSDKEDEDELWEIVGYADADCTVDFSSPSWEEDLRQLMWDILCKYAKDNDLSLTELNLHAV